MLVPPAALEHVSGRASLGPEGAVLLMGFVIDTGYKPHDTAKEGILGGARATCV